MGNKLTPKVILEGTRLTFKTEIAFELQRYYSWIVDRFHISTQAYQSQTLGKKYDLGWMEQRLLPLNFRLVYCTRRPIRFKQRVRSG
jgi:thymidylate kinase